jgi:hypothetical protein
MWRLQALRRLCPTSRQLRASRPVTTVVAMSHFCPMWRERKVAIVRSMNRCQVRDRCSRWRMRSVAGVRDSLSWSAASVGGWARRLRLKAPAAAVVVLAALLMPMRSALRLTRSCLRARPQPHRRSQWACRIRRAPRRRRIPRAGVVRVRRRLFRSRRPRRCCQRRRRLRPGRVCGWRIRVRGWTRCGMRWRSGCR